MLFTGVTFIPSQLIDFKIVLNILGRSNFGSRFHDRFRRGRSSSNER